MLSNFEASWSDKDTHFAGSTGWWPMWSPSLTDVGSVLVPCLGVSKPHWNSPTWRILGIPASHTIGHCTFASLFKSGISPDTLVFLCVSLCAACKIRTSSTITCSRESRMAHSMAWSLTDLARSAWAGQTTWSQMISVSSERFWVSSERFWDLQKAWGRGLGILHGTDRRGGAPCPNHPLFMGQSWAMCLNLPFPVPPCKPEGLYTFSWESTTGKAHL